MHFCDHKVANENSMASLSDNSATTLGGVLPPHQDQIETPDFLVVPVWFPFPASNGELIVNTGSSRGTSGLRSVPKASCVAAPLVTPGSDRDNGVLMHLRFWFLLAMRPALPRPPSSPTSVSTTLSHTPLSRMQYSDYRFPSFDTCAVLLVHSSLTQMPLAHKPRHPRPEQHVPGVSPRSSPASSQVCFKIFAREYHVRSVQKVPVITRVRALHSFFPTVTGILERCNLLSQLGVRVSCISLHFGSFRKSAVQQPRRTRALSRR